MWLHFKHHPKSPTLTINRVPLIDGFPLKSTKALILNTPICNLTLQRNSQTTVTAASPLTCPLCRWNPPPPPPPPSFQSPTLLKIILFAQTVLPQKLLLCESFLLRFGAWQEDKWESVVWGERTEIVSESSWIGVWSNGFCGSWTWSSCLRNWGF